jgi:hypothetical protein
LPYRPQRAPGAPPLLLFDYQALNYRAFSSTTLVQMGEALK